MAAAVKLLNGNKYNVVDSELNYINSKFISLNDDEKKVTSAFFTKFIDSFVKEMKKADKLFENMYQTILHAGSYYDGLKVGKPDEYDLDLIFKLPIDYNEIKITSSPGKPGYVKLKVSELEYLRLIKNQHWNDRYNVMADWFDNNKFFIPDKFRCWLQSVVQNTFNQHKFPNELMVTFTTSGPAITLHVEKGDIKFSIDLVPVLKMENRAPPPAICNIKEAEKSADGKKLSWYVVPKPVKTSNGSNSKSNEVNLNWRLAFHEHEKVLIAGNERLKPALRLLKKFRDSQNFPKIASYYLKTICLWELKKPENNGLWTSGSLSYVFVHLLKAFYESLKVGKIDYYWQKENNLLAVVKKDTIDNNSNTLKKIIDKIEADPRLIPSFILSKREYEQYSNHRGDKIGNVPKEKESDKISNTNNQSSLENFNLLHREIQKLIEESDSGKNSNTNSRSSIDNFNALHREEKQKLIEEKDSGKISNTYNQSSIENSKLHREKQKLIAIVCNEINSVQSIEELNAIKNIFTSIQFFRNNSSGSNREQLQSTMNNATDFYTHHTYM
ncbi:cyclic GMP-AMP synthase-like isoform X2 [Chrysoperla carnea]|uniref:cyclic GMP-AMP synthase-like isoform X2 n=1 Tax=Chrysoperla carnea TaxID=189513 RepID=UPI001D06C393|nr:cyclic GMP-AMP synthase-like isoform X2 [Chrysoperla carnea]